MSISHQPEHFHGPPEIVTVPCKICKQPVQVQLPHEDNMFRDFAERALKAATHSECLEKLDKAAMAARIIAETNSRLETWEHICPEEFRKPIDPSKKGYNATRHSKVMQWVFGEMGLRIIGETRKCKTRFVYQLLHREWKEEREVGAWMHGDLRRELSALGAGNSELLKVFVNRLVALDILFVDDLGKGRATPASEEAFFAIVDARAKHCRPTLFTMNMLMRDFAAACSIEYREPLICRIEEKTILIEFK